MYTSKFLKKILLKKQVDIGIFRNASDMPRFESWPRVCFYMFVCVCVQGEGVGRQLSVWGEGVGRQLSVWGEGVGSV